MRATLSIMTVAAAVVLAAPAVLRADVTTQETTSVKFAGVVGGIMNHFAGDAAKGITSTVALKGNRLERTNPATGEIIDLDEQKVYNLNMKKKEYTVTTFEQLREQWQKDQEQAQKQAQSQEPSQQGQTQEPQKQYQFDVDVKSTGQHKTVAGYDAHETIITITAHEKGKTIDESGGFILTADEWLAPKIAALDQVRDFEMRYFQAVYGSVFTGLDPQAMASMSAMYPAFTNMSGQMQGKIDGTPVSGTMTFETVKSPEDMKASQQQSGGGGIGGMFARKLVHHDDNAKSTVMTTTHEYLSIEPSATAEAVAIPAGFKEKK